jgi:hypothetical protein
MNKNTLVWVGGSLVLLAGLGIAVKIIYFPSKEKIVDELFKFNSNVNKDVAMGMDYGFLRARLMAYRKNEETFFYKGKTYNTSTSRSV